MKDIQAIAKQCTRNLGQHRPRPLRDLLTSLVEDPLSAERNDHYGKGGVVAQLEQEVAEMLGKEGAVFMPSGTMAQPIALRIWSDLAGTNRVAFHPTCHLELHEHKAYQALHHLEAALVGDPSRMFTRDDLANTRGPISALLVELPQREIGGQLPTWEDLQAICLEAKERGMKLHLDGARLWECAPYYGRSYAEIVAPFDSVYVSFYKILGGLPGAILAGPESFIAEARIWQRRQGGNLYNQSVAAIFAKQGIDEHLPRMAEYVAKAQEIAGVLNAFERITVVPEIPPTNMMHVYFEGDADQLLEASIQIAEDEKTALFFFLGPNNKWELTIGTGALEFTAEEVKRLIGKLLA